MMLMSLISGLVPALLTLPPVCSWSHVPIISSTPSLQPQMSWMRAWRFCWPLSISSSSFSSRISTLSSSMTAHRKEMNLHSAIWGSSTQMVPSRMRSVTAIMSWKPVMWLSTPTSLSTSMLSSVVTVRESEQRLQRWSRSRLRAVAERAGRRLARNYWQSPLLYSIFELFNDHWQYIMLAESILRALPFIRSATVKLPRPLRLRIVRKQLGSTFLPRLVNIYRNTLDAVALNNERYLRDSMSPQLRSYLQKARKAISMSSTTTMRISTPSETLPTVSNYILPDRVHRQDNLYLSLTCQAYFGVRYDPLLGIGWAPEQRVYKVGQHRFVVYHSSMSLLENISNIFRNNWLEFTVKYESNQFIQVVDRSSRDSRSMERRARLDEEDEEKVTTIMRIRSSSDDFSWTIVDINQLLQAEQKGK